MKRILLFPIPRRLQALSLALLLGAPLLSAQDQDRKPKGTVVPPWQMEFENLDRASQARYSKSLIEASRLFNQKRIIEALNNVADGETVFANGPALLNIKGACYVELRNFARAREMFTKALDLQKIYMEGIEGLEKKERQARLAPVINILFNLAEMDFVTHRWQDCHERLEFILAEIDPRSVSMQRLVEFKSLLCKLKIDQVEEARKLADKYDYLDDNPYYYYAHSAIAYFDKDTEAAERWRSSARRVFRSQRTLAPWEDTMIEFGYVKSFYGGDLEEAAE